MLKDINQIFTSLNGEWKLERQIVDVNTKASHQATGIARFTWANPTEKTTYAYKETGKLELEHGGHSIQFNRRYIYQLKEDAIHIILDDGVTKGKLFQTLIPQKTDCGFVGSEHVCRADKHNGEYQFINENSFKTAFTIKGPKNHVQIKTTFTKL